MERTEQATALIERDAQRRQWRRIATVSVLAPMVAFGALAVSATGAEAAVPATGGEVVGTPTQTGRFRVSIFATSTAGSAGSAGVNVTVTVDPAHSTNVEFLDQAPASVVDGAPESDQYVRSFAEQYNKVLAGDLTVGGSTIPAGTRVNVYYLHADHVGSENLATKFGGSEWFGSVSDGVRIITLTP